MTYTPKPGDRVTSPLLVGEWEVTEAHWTVELYVSLRQDRVRLPRILAERLNLTPVAPPLPPEPPVGSVVRANGLFWQRDGRWWGMHRVETTASFEDVGWADLATAPDLSPVVAVEDVAEWLDGEGIASPYYLDRFRAKFGGWGE